MKSEFFSSLTSILLLLIVIPGIISGITSAADEESNDDGNSTNNAFPDLIVESISFDPASPESGKTVTIIAKVTNQGGAASEATDLDFSVDGSSLDPSEVPALEAGESKKISLSDSLTSNNGDAVEITARVDSKDSVEESNEDNNEKTASLSFKNGESPDESTDGSPDLIVDTLELPKTVELGEKVSLQISVKNIGDQPSSPTKVVSYNGRDKKEWDIPELDPSSSSSVSYTWIPESKGTVEIKAVVDEDNSVKESNEGNNEKSTTVTVAEDPLPDLIIEDIVPEIPEPQVGKPVNFTIKVKNQGSSDSKETTVKYYINGAAGESIAVPAIPQGESRDAIFSVTPDKVGTMTVKAVADSGTSVYESNEDNNALEKTVNVRAVLPDLMIDSLSLNPGSPKPGESVTFTVTIKNNGPGDSSENELKYNINGNNESYSRKIPVSALSAGSTTTGTFSWAPQNEGKLEIGAQVDSGNIVSESDENNNKITKTVTVSNSTVSSGGGSSGSQSSSSSGESSDSSGESSDSSGGSSDSSNGMGSGTTSKEPVDNIEIKELSTRHIINGYHVKFEFLEGATCINYIEFDPKLTFKRTTAIVEVLKNKSVFVPKPAPGKIYKNVNAWIGDKGAGLPDSSENAFIEFKVEKKWIKDNNVSEPLISLQWYDEGWQPLYTEKVKEDESFAYFKAKAKGFSSFAITEYTEEDRIKAEAQGGKIQETLKDWEKQGKASLLNGSAEKEGLIKDPMGKAKIFMAISLPLFTLAAGYLIVKKKI